MFRGALLPVSSRVAIVTTLAVAMGLFVTHEVITRRAFDASVAAETIVTNAGPSVVVLAQLRSGLRQLRQEAARYERRGGTNREDLNDAVEQVTERLAEYERLPSEPEERRLQPRLHEVIASLRSATNAVVRDGPDKVRDLVRLGDEGDEIAERLIEMNARDVSRAARAVTERHDRAAWSSLVLLSLSMGIMGALGVALDRLASRTERERTERLRELDAFAARVAHDLRSPLQPCSLAIELVRRDPGLGPASARHLERALRGLARTTDLIDALLAFARAGGRPEVGARAHVLPVSREVAAALSSVAEDESARLEIDVDPLLEVAVPAPVLGTMIANLARNALLYLGPARDRTVTIRARASARGRATIEVRDRGPGIPPEALARIFRPFERASSRVGGHGLGLATVRRLAEAYGGSVVVSSTVGAGSTFTVSLPGAERRSVPTPERMAP